MDGVTLRLSVLTLTYFAQLLEPSEDRGLCLRHTVGQSFGINFEHRSLIWTLPLGIMQSG